MTRKASLWARPSCPSRASREPCGGPGLWEPQAAWLSSPPSEPEQVLRPRGSPCLTRPFPWLCMDPSAPARPKALPPAPFLRSSLPCLPLGSLHLVLSPWKLNDHLHRPLISHLGSFLPAFGAPGSARFEFSPSYLPENVFALTSLLKTITSTFLAARR